MSRADQSRGVALRIVRKAPEGTTFRNTFMIEAMLLLLCVMVLVAVVMTILGFSYVKGQEASDLNRAITIAANAAERFEADPVSMPRTQEVDGFQVECAQEEEPQGAGALHHAHISVRLQNEELYTLSTSRYVSEGGVHHGA